MFICETGDTIATDGEIIEGLATIDESAITGESAPVIREAGGDKSSVTGGTKVLSDHIKARVTSEPGESFLDKMIALVEGASRQKTPNEIALTILLAAFTLIFVIVCVTLKPFADYANAPITITAFISLFVCLIPTTIGGLLSAIGIAGMDRALRANVITKSGKAVETAGDIDVLLLDKTGTITIGNRKATHFYPSSGISEADFIQSAVLSSLADATPEGKSTVELAGNEIANSLSIEGATLIKFTAETRTSGVVLSDGTNIRKGAQDAAKFISEQAGNTFPETYYSYDFGNPDNHLRPNFLYNFNRHNEVNLNLGLIKATYITENVRGNLGLMVGTYPEYNLSAEQDLIKNVYEATIGVKISDSHNLWIDAGIMPAHIGFESAVGKDCPTLTRSILAENSPYYEAGVKMGYTSPSEKWYLAAMYLNGWQRIQKIDGNQTPAFGTKVTYKPNAKVVLNWSTYAGNEQADSIKKWRYFNNFYGQFKVSEKTNLIAGFDVGVQQVQKASDKYSIWYAPIVILQYKLIEKVQLAARAEYYEDEKGVIIATETANEFKTYGFSANFDYLPVQNVIFRVEARTLNSKDAVFLKDNNPTATTVFVTTSLAYSF